MIAPPVVPTLPCKAPEYRTVGRFPEASCESRVIERRAFTALREVREAA
jgi:hypothetical protein